MAKPRTFQSLPQTEMLRKYTEEHWPERLAALRPEVNEKHWNASGPHSTVIKQEARFYDADNDLGGAVLTYTRADRSIDTIVLYLSDGVTAFITQ